ncbi:MAG: peptide deformylase, partial [bacterium]|nr:peptide deformylase [bacterium]
DHLEGVLCLDKMAKDKIMSRDEYKKMREAAMNEN